MTERLAYFLLACFMLACLIDWLTDWLTDWLIDWLVDWLGDWLIHWSSKFCEIRPKALDGLPQLREEILLTEGHDVRKSSVRPPDLFMKPCDIAKKTEDWVYCNVMFTTHYYICASDTSVRSSDDIASIMCGEGVWPVRAVESQVAAWRRPILDPSHQSIN